MKVIDFHVHPYLTEEEFISKYPECFAPSPEQAEADLRGCGITRICGSVIGRTPYEPEKGFDYFRELNRKALELKEKFGSFYIPGFHVHPDYIDESCREIEFMQEKGFRLIGELTPYQHGWRNYSCESFSEILNEAGKYHMIVSYHTVLGEQEEMERMVAAHPDVIFAAAHPGERQDYDRHLERMMKHENLYLDLSGTGLFRYGMLAYGVRRVGADRFLFGTDYPICNPGMYVQAVLREPLTEREKEQILFRNAERLLGKTAEYQSICTTYYDGKHEI
ncbi:MAG: amidohydrolase [Roseburia sp.]|nr:amidohydrolase [Roseburia sp.]MCM1098809.1 amidohydrolase [Ruminococcus flavefaciens]